MAQLIADSLKGLVFDSVVKSFPSYGLKLEDISLEHPAVEEHGDYSTNIALVLSRKLGKPSVDVAKEIVEEIKKILDTEYQPRRQAGRILDTVQVAGPGFINFSLTSSWQIEQVGQVLAGKANFGKNDLLSGKKIMVEYAHPNTHKEMHIGHMRTLVTGEALVRILEAAGAKVFRANYQGDIGPHVAKAIWGTRKLLREQKLTWDQAEKKNLRDKVHLLGQGYVRGNKDYEDNKEEIDRLNKQLYRKDQTVWPDYERTRRWSLEYYDMFYRRFYTKFDRLYFESEVANPGKEIVLANIGKVFEESEGAVVFRGETGGLHTRVFVTKDGNPTYEAKEMALGPLEYSDFPFDECIHVVANEQAGYFQVVFKALELVDSRFKGREFHLSMGMVNLIGKKISSRTGVVVTVDDLIDDVKDLLRPVLQNRDISKEEKEDVLEDATVGAVKYSVLKGGPLQNVAFDLERSVSLEGDSGPYLQYTYARAKSVLRKSKVRSEKLKVQTKSEKLTPEEFAVLRYLYRFPEVVEAAARTYSPNLACSYLFELAKRYNNFYNNVPILAASSEELGASRLQLTEAVSIVLKNGLNLLGIAALETM